MALLYQVSYLFLLFLFCVNFLVNSRHLCDPKEHLALLEFKKSFSLDKYASLGCGENGSYPKIETWKESRDCCSWDGVDCHQGHVVGLDLRCSFLDGTLHPNGTLFTLSHLQTLNLSYNDFHHSPFSPQFGTFKNLRVLDLSYSGFEGKVPSEISHLSRLVSLHLSDNDICFSNVVMNQLVHNLTHLTDFALDGLDLSNVRPTSFMNFSLSLASLSLSSCFLTGNFPDQYILGLPNLRVLDLSLNTELKGHLSVSSWSKSLEILDLSWTNFSGGISNSIGEATSLRHLDLGGCNFKGEIPDFQIHSNPSMGQVSNCLFNLTQEASSNSFSSPLIANVCSDHPLSNLIYLDLTGNSFISVIPSWIYALPRLTNLGLNGNHFFSTFMRDFRSNSLEYLDLSSNNLQGEISKSIYRQVNLTTLRLDSNNLSGVLNLDMLLRIQNLEFLDVSYNSQLSIFSTNVVISTKNLHEIYMSSVKLEKFPYFLRYQKNLRHLNLSNNQIRGEIPKWVSELGALVFLDLSHNLLSSGMELLLTLPNLDSVHLDFNLFNKLPILMSLPPLMRRFKVLSNQLRGSIHPSICQATNLIFLDLSNNSLSGAIPSCLFNMTNLDSLILKRNNFSGVIPMPPPSILNYIASENQFIGEISPSICQLAPDLVVLSLSNNRLSGTIPPCLVNMPFLKVLDLKNNNFTGTLPKKISTRSQLLTSLDLNNNQIEGELSPSLLNCKYHEVMDLGNNKITGYFPHWLEAASNLQVLILRSNRFYGHINNSMNENSFPNLRIIDLSHNNLSGPLPSNLFLNLRAMKEIEVGDIYPQRDSYYQDSLVLTLKGSEQKFERILMICKVIDLSSNDFMGEIPESVGMLVFLKGLNLSHNKFTGEIPTSFGNLINLEALDLSSNKLMDNIPSQLTGLTCLSFLNLSQNQLSGPIPQGKQFATFESSSYIGNLGLCGFPLPNCDAKKVHKSQLLHEEGDSLENGFWWKVVFVGYGCGMPFGMFVGYLVFRMGKPVWIVAMVEGKTRKKNYKTMRRNN